MCDEKTAELGRKIIDLREQSHLTSYDLARLSGRSMSYLHYVEHGEILPDIRTLTKIANALGVDAKQLLAMRNRVIERRDSNMRDELGLNDLPST